MYKRHSVTPNILSYEFDFVFIGHNLCFMHFGDARIIGTHKYWQIFVSLIPFIILIIMVHRMKPPTTQIAATEPANNSSGISFNPCLNSATSFPLDAIPFWSVEWKHWCIKLECDWNVILKMCANFNCYSKYYKLSKLMDYTGLEYMRVDGFIEYILVFRRLISFFQGRLRDWMKTSISPENVKILFWYQQIGTDLKHRMQRHFDNYANFSITANLPPNSNLCNSVGFFRQHGI